MEYNISAITHDVIERKKKKNRILIFFISHTSKIQSKKKYIKKLDTIITVQKSASSTKNV